MSHDVACASLATRASPRSSQPASAAMGSCASFWPAAHQPEACFVAHVGGEAAAVAARRCQCECRAAATPRQRGAASRHTCVTWCEIGMKPPQMYIHSYRTGLIWPETTTYRPPGCTRM
eukprot:4167166-Prymnesium_polylepis.1